MPAILNRVKTALTGALLLTLPLGACAVSMPAPGGPPVPARAPGTLDEVLARDVLVACAQARTRAGAPVLVADERLDAAAREFAVELARTGRLTHTSRREGSTTVVQRVSRAQARVSRVAENLARLPHRRDVGAEVVRLWLRSRGHRRNLLNPAYSHVGTAVAAGSGGNWYVVQVYAAP